MKGLVSFTDGLLLFFRPLHFYKETFTAETLSPYEASAFIRLCLSYLN